ncbi:hypothetical protein RCL_jg13897.t1 [Rhizophagus clarus]|uniref:Uncharacterized protein n=1 Tax=Rhizophagus clarus TaxID=94130 RepID=A0A8H3QTJ0_9GLOM|nr:hypothetical protein RCL_jg13897.t1 [Rhizophagus clarus]
MWERDKEQLALISYDKHHCATIFKNDWFTPNEKKSNKVKVSCFPTDDNEEFRDIITRLTLHMETSRYKFGHWL